MLILPPARHRSATFVLAFVGMAALSSAADAQRSPTRPAAAIDTIRFETMEGTGLSFDISLDGRTLVVDLLGQLWTLPLGGGRAHALTDAVRDTAHDADPVLSPDGRWLAFVSDRAGGAGIWLMPAAGGSPRRISPEVSGWDTPARPAWSPDSRQLAWTLGDTIRVADIVTGNMRNLEIRGLRAPAARDPAFTPDGAHIVFANAAGWARNGGRLWAVPAAGGDARPIARDSVRGMSPIVAPDGARLAWIARDSAGIAQVYVADTGQAQERRITSHADVVPFRVRWTRDGRELLYSADGHLWKVSAEGGEPSRIPLSATVTLPRPKSPAPASLAPVAGSRREARGFMGLALSPDASHIAAIALGHLWEIPVQGEPRRVREVPYTAAGLSWSPDGASVIWSAGSGGSEDLFVTSMRTGATRQLTALPGREDRATWSPDGRHIAFLHWHPAPADSAPWLRQGWELRIRVVRADAERVSSQDQTIDLGAVPGYTWSFSSLAALGQERPQWSPTSDAVLRFGASEDDTTAVVLPIDGSEPRVLPRFPARIAFVQWARDSTLLFVRENQLWSAAFDPRTGSVGEPHRVSDDAALYPSIARDGSILYVSSDGLRLRDAGGTTRTIGWPLTFRVPRPPALLIRNARVIDGTGAPPGPPSDLLVEDGRIARIARAGRLRAPREAQVLDVAGRTIIPGLMDLHAHLWDDAVVRASLAYGITTGREMGTAIARAAGFRDAVDAGALQGMRLVLGGFQFNPAAEDRDFSGSVIQMTSGRERAERALSLATAFGAHFAKMRFPGNVPRGVTFIQAAATYGMRISGHCAVSLAFLAAGLDGKEHLGASCDERFDEKLYGDVAGLLRATDTWVVPTITAFGIVPRMIGDSTLVGSAEPLVPATPFLWWWSLRFPPGAAATYGRFANDARAAARQLHAAGVTLGSGSDVAAPGWALHMELEELVGAGMSPLQALTAATGTAARILGAEDVGTIRVGSRADLVVLDADPLADIRNTRKIHTVVLGGRIVDRTRAEVAAAEQPQAP